MNTNNHCPCCNQEMVVKIDTIVVGLLTVNMQEKKVEVKGKPVDLTRTEFKVLECLLTNIGQIVDREKLLSYVWSMKRIDIESRIVDVYIGYLRKKLGKGVIRCARGFGYSIYR